MRQFRFLGRFQFVLLAHRIYNSLQWSISRSFYPCLLTLWVWKHPTCCSGKPPRLVTTIQHEPKGIYKWTNQEAGFNRPYVRRFRLLECLDSINNIRTGWLLCEVSRGGLTMIQLLPNPESHHKLWKCRPTVRWEDRNIKITGIRRGSLAKRASQLYSYDSWRSNQGNIIGEMTPNILIHR